MKYKKALVYYKVNGGPTGTKSHADKDSKSTLSATKP